MARTLGGHIISKSKSHKIVIPQDILSQIESLPNRKCEIKWQDWEDEVILKYCGIKSFTAIGKILGKTRTATTERYHKLIESKGVSDGKNYSQKRG